LIYLKEKIRTIFNLGRSNCKVSWKDEDNDDVTIETDEELLIALQELVGPVYKLQVVKTEDFVPDHDHPNAGSAGGHQETKQDGEVHYGVSCDGCDGSVQGFRYKCMVCPDYDLCGLCEAKGLHPGHNMIRIASPESIWPRHFMNRLHKMNARAARCHSSNANESSTKKADDKKPEETTNPEGQNPNFGPWNWSARHGQRRSHHGGSRPRSAFGGSNFAGTGSMDDPVVADVDFSDLANLQANLHKHLSQHFGKHFGTPMTPPCGKKAKEDSSSTTEAATEATPEAAPEVVPEPAKEVKPEEATTTTPKEELSPRMKKVRDEMIKIHEQVHKMKISDADMDIMIPVEELEIPIKKAKTDDEQVAIPMPWNKEPTLEEPSMHADYAMEASAPLMEVEESQAKKSDVVVEEWTILDKSNSPTPDTEMPKLTSTTTNPQGAEALYPKLDDETTTKNDEESAEAMNKIKNQIDLSKYSMKVQVAIQAMENMGFSNEDGWLSSLLEKYDGDIGKVLDLLQPVKPVRN